MVSLFDFLGPVMVGPSSSHTAGAGRLGRMAHDEPGTIATVAGVFAKEGLNLATMRVDRSGREKDARESGRSPPRR